MKQIWQHFSHKARALRIGTKNSNKTTDKETASRFSWIRWCMTLMYSFQHSHTCFNWQMRVAKQTIKNVCRVSFVTVVANFHPRVVANKNAHIQSERREVIQLFQLGLLSTQFIWLEKENFLLYMCPCVGCD